MQTTRPPAGSVVVGVDDSPGATHAVRWAADQAKAEHRTLTLLCSAGRAESEHTLERAAALATTMHPRVEVARLADEGDPRTALLEASRDAHLLVVGSRGRGPVRSLLLGSVAVAVSRHASCPVVVVRPERPDRTGRERSGVVVGADACPESAPVLEFAFRHASLHGRPLTVTHVFWGPMTRRHEAHQVPASEPGLDDLRLLLAESVAGLSTRFPDVAVSQELSRGFVDVCLADAGDDADLLVVGRHHRSTTSRILSGAVADAVLEHAHGPVAVVPEGPEQPDPGFLGG